MDLIFIFIFLFFGLIIGSFLNVVIYRLNTSKTLGGRSACMSCNKQLCFYELVPLFSFLFLGGRCRGCKSKISIQYPLVELSSGFIFALVFIKLQAMFFIAPLLFSSLYFYYVLMLSILLVITVYDLKHKIIPDSMVFTFSILAFLSLFFIHTENIALISGFSLHHPSLLQIFSGLILASPFALLWLVSSGKWMGFGDVKLIFGIGYFLALGSALSAVALAFWTGALFGIGLILFQKNSGMKTEIPFALYLFLGTLVSFIFNLHLFLF